MKSRTEKYTMKIGRMNKVLRFSNVRFPSKYLFFNVLIVESEHEIMDANLDHQHTTVDRIHPTKNYDPDHACDDDHCANDILLSDASSDECSGEYEIKNER